MDGRVLLALLVAASGCAGSGASPDLQEMKRAEDVSQCVKVPDGPCGCANGGSSIAINGEYEKEYMEMMDRQNNQQVACPAVYQCFDTGFKLVNGSCSLSYSTSGQLTE